MTDITEQALWQALHSVIDPDFGENIVDLGLVCAVQTASRGGAKIDIITMTPYSAHAGTLAEEVRRAVHDAGLSRVTVRLVDEPAWTPYRMAASLRALLGLPDLEPEPPGQIAPAASWRGRLRRRLADF